MKSVQLDHHRPPQEEFAEYYAGYIAKIPAQGAYDHFIGQMDRMTKQLEGLSTEQEDFRYAVGKWSIKEVVRHIADAERVFAYRMLCISRGEKGALPGFDQDAYAVDTPVDHLSLSDLLNEMAASRNSTIALVNNMSADGWTKVGVASGWPASVRAIFFITAGHMEHHIQLFDERYLSVIS